MEPQVRPLPGQIWEHFRGGLYQVVGLATPADGDPEEEENSLVVYKSLRDGRMWTRTLSEWLGTVEREDGNTVFRFTYLLKPIPLESIH